VIALSFLFKYSLPNISIALIKEKMRNPTEHPEIKNRFLAQKGA
jgi:hypothetical protein